MEIRRTLVLTWVCLLSLVYTSCCEDNEGVDIGFPCENDMECIAGNGGEYSKCNKHLSVCICTVTVIGEDKCKYTDIDPEPKVTPLQKETKKACALECSAEGTWQWSKDMDWYGKIPKPFSSRYIPDRKTSVCFEPKRALNTLPEGIVVNNSTIPGAGLGAFTEVYIERDTVFGPYKGIRNNNEVSPYSWTIYTEKEKSGEMYVDGSNVQLSNWLRYINTPTTTEMENLAVLQYKDDIYYVAFNAIRPGTELFVWYGNSYAEELEIEEFEHPDTTYAKTGYAGGSCYEWNKGKQCRHDKNTICADDRCLCIPGTTLRSGLCIQDETLGGKCHGADGTTCLEDENVECQKGLCVCKNKTSPANGECIPGSNDVDVMTTTSFIIVPDETAGGRCSGHDGEGCMLDSNAECERGLCYCKYGTSQIGRICKKDGDA